MHIHLYISEFAPSGERLKTALRDTLGAVPVIQYYNIEGIGRVMPAAYDDQAVAVVMVADTEELTLLAEKQYIWDRIKTVLVLPDSEPETLSLGHALRPRFVTYMENNFSEIVAVLDHIRNNGNGGEPP